MLYDKVFENVVNGMCDYVTSCKLSSMVLGISGGIDSTVVAGICKEVSKRTGIKLIGVSLMCSTNKDDEASTADMVGSEFCDVYDKVNLDELYKTTSMMLNNNELSGGKYDKVIEGNIKARLRMIWLWQVGARHKGVVVDTDNKTEWHLGFWTIHGDSNYITPIGGLWKHEVYGLAKYMLENIYKDSESLKASMALTPTDGNGVSSSDLEQIGGKSYDDVDDILYHWVSLTPSMREKFKSDNLTNSIKGTVFDVEDDESRSRRIEQCKRFNVEFVPSLGDKYGVDIVRKVIMRSINSEFKRKKMPLIINVNNGRIEEEQ